MFFSLACAALSVPVGVHLAQTYGLNPADGGALAPLTVRLAWGIGVTLLGVGFSAAMWLYGRCYVARLDLDETAHQLHVYTLRFFGTARHVYDVDDVVGIRRHRWRYIGEDWVDAPWYTLRLAGRRLPFILDAPGGTLHRQWRYRLRGGRHRRGKPPLPSQDTSQDIL